MRLKKHTEKGIKHIEKCGSKKEVSKISPILNMQFI